MPADSEPRYPALSEAVRHFLARHWGDRSEASLAAALTASVGRHNRAAPADRRIATGTSAKALSHWKSGRHRPQDGRVLGELGRLVGCTCRDRSGRPYPDAAVAEIGRATPAETGEPLDAAATAALLRAEQLTRVTALDYDRVGSLDSGRSLTLSQVYVPRRAETGLLERLSKPSLTAVVGEAGYGKTALMWNLHRSAGAAGRTPFLVPATALLHGLERPDGEHAITVEELAVALRAARRRRRRPVLLVDTLDLLSHSPAARAAVDQVLGLAARLKVPVLVACRPIEAGWLGLRDGEDDPAGDGTGPADLPFGMPVRTVTLTQFLTDRRGDEVGTAIEKYARASYPDDQHDAVASTIKKATIQGRALREVVSSPLNLRVLFELYAPATPEPDVDGLALYDRVWQWRVVTDGRGGPAPGTGTGADLSGPVQRTALAMLERGQISVGWHDLRAWLGAATEQGRDVVELMRARSLLVVRARADLLWFFHQTQFEHAAARAVAACGPEAATALAAFVAEDPHDLLYGEVAGQLLLLASRHPGNGTPVSVAERLLTGWLGDAQHGLRVLGLRTYARYRSPSPALTAAAREAIAAADNRAARDFLRLLPSITHPRAERWRDDLTAAWRRRELRLECVRTLIRLHAQHPADAAELTEELEVFDWLRDQPKKQLRGHDHVYLQLLETLVEAEPEMCQEQAVGFWRRFGELGITAGLTDILDFLQRHDLRDPGDLATVDRTLRGLTTQDPTTALQRAYLAYRGVETGGAEELTASVAAVLADRADRELWRRIRMRRIGAALLRLPPAEAHRLLDHALALPADPGELEMCTVLGSELLVGAALEPHLPFAPHVAARCRDGLRRPGVPRRFWVLALRNVELDDDHLRPLFGEGLTDPLTWLSPTELGPMVVAAAGAGAAPALEALTWAFTSEGRETVLRELPDGAAGLKHVRKLLQFRAARMPAFLTLLCVDAMLTRDARDLCGGVEKMSAAELLGAVEARDALAAARRSMVGQRRPDHRRQGFKLWRLLVEREADEPPLPDDIGAALDGTRDAELINALLSFAAALVEHDAWTDLDAEALRTVLTGYVSAGVNARQDRSLSAQTRRRLTNREELSRQVLAGLLARVVPLPEDRAARDGLRAELESVVFDPGYDLSDPTQLQAFTPAMTALGRLPERLVAVDRGEAIDAFLTFVRRVHSCHPEPVKWKVTVATKWQFMVGSLVAAATPRQRRRLAEDLLALDHDLAGHALTACITRSPERPPWLYQLVDQLTGTAHSSVRATLYEYDREQSRRHWAAAHDFAARLNASPAR